jgi:hypothetical protein
MDKERDHFPIGGGVMANVEKIAKGLRINNLVKYVNLYCLELCSSNRHETV